MNENMIITSSFEKLNLTRHNSPVKITRKNESTTSSDGRKIQRAHSERIICRRGTTSIDEKPKLTHQNSTADAKMKNEIAVKRSVSDLQERRKLERANSERICRERSSSFDGESRKPLRKDSRIRRSSSTNEKDDSQDFIRKRNISMFGAACNNEESDSSSADMDFPMPLVLETVHPDVMEPASVAKRSNEQVSSAINKTKRRPSSNKPRSSGGYTNVSLKKSSETDMKATNDLTERPEFTKEQNSVIQARSVCEQRQDILKKIDLTVDKLLSQKEFSMTIDNGIADEYNKPIRKNSIEQVANKRMLRSRQQQQERLMEKERQRAFQRGNLIRQDSTRLRAPKIDIESDDTLSERICSSGDNTNRKTREMISSNHDKANSITSARTIRQKSISNKSTRKIRFDSSCDVIHAIKPIKQYKADLWFTPDECDNNRQRDTNLLFPEDTMPIGYPSPASLYVRAMLQCKEEINAIVSNNQKVGQSDLKSDTFQDLKTGIKYGHYGINSDAYLGHVQIYVQKIVLSYRSCQNILNFQRNDIDKLIRSQSESLTKADRSYAAIVGHIMYQDCIEMDLCASTKRVKFHAKAA